MVLKCCSTGGLLTIEKQVDKSTRTNSTSGSERASLESQQYTQRPKEHGKTLTELPWRKIVFCHGALETAVHQEEPEASTCRAEECESRAMLQVADSTPSFSLRLRYTEATEDHEALDKDPCKTRWERSGAVIEVVAQGWSPKVRIEHEQKENSIRFQVLR